MGETGLRWVGVFCPSREPRGRVCDLWLSSVLKSTARSLGVDLRRYDVAASDVARFHHLLKMKQVDLVVDVGANEGQYGKALLEGGYRGSILSIEPLSQAYDRLILAAQVCPSWHVAPRTAVGDVDGMVDMNIAGNSVSSSVLPMLESHARAAPGSRYRATERVQMIRLDSLTHPMLCRSRTIFLKVDAQGYEMHILRGASSLLEKVVGLQIELSLLPLYEGQETYLQVLAWLGQRGFGLWGLLPGFVDRSSGRLMQFDGLLFKD
jgi:FkbM family methyltransferase